MPSSIAITLTFSTSAPPSAVWAAIEAAPRWPEVLDDLREAWIEPTRALDKIIVFLARRRYLGPFKAGIQKRMRAMLTLAERITDESIIARESADGLQAVNEW